MVTTVNPLNQYGQNVSRGMHPKLAKSLMLAFNFAADTNYVVNLPLSPGISNATGLDYAQSMLVDNANNAANTVFTFDNGYEFTCPPFAIGMFPIFIGLNSLKYTAVSTGGVNVNTWLLNTREQPAVWSAKFPIAGTINVTGSVITSSPTPGLLTDRSIALAAGGTAQQLMAANGNRLGFSIKNPGTLAAQNIAAPEPAYITFGAGAAVAAQGSWELLPGETLTAAGMGICSTQAIFVNATTTGHIITAKET